MTKLLKIYKRALEKIKLTVENIGSFLALSWLAALAMIALLLLTGCSYFETPQPAIPASIASACPDSPPFEGKTLGDLMGYTVELLNMYHECQAKMDAVVVWADRA